MDTSELIKQVKSRPAIWSEPRKDNKKLAAAWKHVCKAFWPEFDSWTVDQKRIKGLELQKKWDKLQQSFIREHLRHKQGFVRRASPMQCSYYNQLSFLAPTVDKKCSTQRSSNGPARPIKPETSTPTPAPSASSATPAPSATPPAPDRDAEEDRQFLLSLVSFMQDVPRSRKLALRSEMIQVIAKYSGGDSLAEGDSNSPPPYMAAESQEY